MKEHLEEAYRSLRSAQIAAQIAGDWLLVRETQRTMEQIIRLRGEAIRRGTITE